MRNYCPPQINRHTIMKPYFLYEGIKEIAAEFSGEENVYLGIRPYGFHAGNQLPFMVYTYLLCEETKKNGKEPRYNFYLFFNDWEQDGLDGPNPQEYPFNILPKNTTLQFSPSGFEKKAWSIIGNP